jgi:hypothetical protein
MRGCDRPGARRQFKGLAAPPSFPPGYVFSFFAGMMVLQLIWVKTMVPETKGVPLEQIQRQLGIE